MRAFIAVLLISELFCVLSCSKKTSDPLPVPPKPEFYFTYNGQTYSDVVNCSIMLDGSSRWEGILINRTDLLGGAVYLFKNNCAFLDPGITTVYGAQPNCILTYAGGVPIDSSRVFIYKTGSISHTYSDCVRKKTPDLVFGGFIEYDECTLAGSFNFILGNNAGQQKSISGSFRYYNIRR